MSRVLYAVLDWGLGHATRSSVLIDYLIDQGCTVDIYTGGNAEIYLRQRFPDLKIIPTRHLCIRSHSRASSFIRWPYQLLRQYLRDRRWSRRHAASYDRIISDGRSGIRSRHCPAAFINHQVQIQHYDVPLSGAWSRIVRGLSAKYQQLWIPDYQDPKKSLAGPLSRSIHTHTYYLGPLSSWQLSDGPAQLDVDVLVILSGIEPARTHLQDRLIALLSTMPDITWELVTGTQVSDNSYHEMLSSDELSSLVGASRIVIARSGYSTIMDLHLAGKRAILIPTPGQPEQEYLAEHLPQNLVARTEESLTAEDIISVLSSKVELQKSVEDNRWKDVLTQFVH